MDGHRPSELFNRHVGGDAVALSNQRLVAVLNKLLEELVLCLALLLHKRGKSFMLRHKETAHKRVE